MWLCVRVSRGLTISDSTFTGPERFPATPAPARRQITPRQYNRGARRSPSWYWRSRLRHADVAPDAPLSQSRSASQWIAAAVFKVTVAPRWRAAAPPWSGGDEAPCEAEQTSRGFTPAVSATRSAGRFSRANGARRCDLESSNDRKPHEMLVRLLHPTERVDRQKTIWNTENPAVPAARRRP